MNRSSFFPLMLRISALLKAPCRHSLMIQPGFLGKKHRGSQTTMDIPFSNRRCRCMDKHDEPFAGPERHR